MSLTLKSPSCSENKKIDFIDLGAQQALIRPKIDGAIQRVLNHGTYIMGPEVRELEERLAQFCGVKNVISCANGTDALGLVLMAKGVGKGDAIFVPSFTFAATAEVVAWVGATPVFIDSLEDTFNMDPQSLKKGIKKAEELGLTPKGIIPVDLFGQPADYAIIQGIADEHQLWVLADAAQSFGGSYKGTKVGNIGDAATTSFFPAKPLGCYGDGGAIFTNDDELLNILKSLRVHGQGNDGVYGKYDNVRVGLNARLDTIQAAILIEKLNIFEEEVKQRQIVAKRYTEGLKNSVRTPLVLDDTLSAWAQYTVVLPEHVKREALIQSLQAKGIPTVIYYVKPLHLQLAYKHYPAAESTGLPACERLSQRVLSLPMHPYLDKETQDYIIGSLVEELI
ncbi:MAG: DegT/DnrJ/EryC1/StrS aminotransferase family protein [Bacteroidota bacterium]|nr:DegT/DnrJ/EryC1/StrS aminotransferase family protein [Bacteroidota bacterium]